MPDFDFTIDQQNLLAHAFSELDGRDVDGKRVPYKLGAHRRVLVKNTNALNASITVWQETSNAIFREFFPDVPDGTPVQESDDPETFSRYRKAIIEAAKKTDKVSLLPLPESVVYQDDNDMPADALAILDRHGLIVQE